jgi:hypothetical protein
LIPHPVCSSFAAAAARVVQEVGCWQKHSAVSFQQKQRLFLRQKFPSVFADVMGCEC